ncbi:MAG: adenine phosphoribosyltransferase [Planctomycetota bacterium]|nr:MAG: adenine phosphoribosyltransferase [Planctomycetota bacterium]
MDFSFHEYIRTVPDFPKEGILFKDITPLLQNKKALHIAINRMVEPYIDQDIEYVCGIESRGFIFATAIAFRLNAGMIPIRKRGKLPWKTQTIEYDLEYGTDHLQIHEDAIPNQGKVLMVDDLLATGGTMEAACKLVESLGGMIHSCLFLVELEFLNGRDRLSKYHIHSLVKY